jgi:hypothetical protein
MTETTCKHCRARIRRGWAFASTVWIAVEHHPSGADRTRCPENSLQAHSPDPGVASPRGGAGDATPHQT